MNIRRLVHVALIPGVLGLGLALAATTYTVQWQGRTVPGNAIVQNGTTYVSSDALKAAGIAVTVKGRVVSLAPVGGANQVAALEGCLNEWMFNGIWRVRVTDARPIPGDRHGRSYRFEFRNGTTTSGFAPSGTGWGGIQLALDSGTTVPAENVNEVSDPPYVAGGSHAQVINFYWDDPARTPQRLLVLFNANEMNTSMPVKFSVPDPSLRIRTTCQK